MTEMVVSCRKAATSGGLLPGRPVYYKGGHSRCVAIWPAANAAAPDVWVVVAQGLDAPCTDVVPSVAACFEHCVAVVERFA